MNSAVFGVAQALPSDDQEVGNDENAASGPNELLHSPRATIRTFLEAMSQNPPQTDMGVLCMDISEIPSAKAPELAIFLYRCLNRIEYIDLNDPRVPSIDDLRRAGEDAVTSWTLFPRDLTEPPPAGAVRDGWERLDQAEIAEKQQRFRLIEELVPEARIVLRRMRSGEWKFSAQTVAGIEELWDQIRTLQPVDAFAGEEYRTLAERIEAQWPEPLVEGRFIGVRYWQWITLFLVILAGIILDFLVRGILTVLAIRVIQRHEGRAKPESIRRTVRPFGLTAAALLWLWAIGVLGLPVDAMKVLVPAVKLFAMLAIVWAAFRLTDLSSEYFAYKA